MINIKKIMISLCTIALLVGCGGSTPHTKSDMSGYKELKDDDPAFYDFTVKDLTKAIDNKETLVVYLGFTNCPWCNEAIPILNDLAKANGQEVAYINTRLDPSWESNIDIDDYDLFVEYFDGYLDYDEEGIKHLYVPVVIFIKDGEIKLWHEGTVDDHDATERKMTEDEIEELTKTYQEGFEAIK